MQPHLREHSPRLALCPQLEFCRILLDLQRIEALLTVALDGAPPPTPPGQHPPHRQGPAPARLAMVSGVRPRSRSVLMETEIFWISFKSLPTPD